MDMTDVYKFVKSETLTISSDSPMPNVYNPLSESKQIKTEMPGVSGKDVLQEHSYCFSVETESADSTLSEGGHMVLDDLTPHRRHVKANESTDLLESQRTLIPDVKETIESLPTVKAVEEKAFVCDICQQKFPRNSILTQHRRSHKGEKPFICDICDKRYSYLTNFTRHKHSCHTGGNPLVCDFCGKLFLLPDRLAEHRRFHTGEKQFVCDFCGKELAHTFNLKQHKRIHTGEKPCMCEFCGKRFTQASNLTQHKLIHTGDKPFICDVCDQRFSSSLREHKRSHNLQKPCVRLLWSDLKSYAKQANPYVRKPFYKHIVAKNNTC